MTVWYDVSDLMTWKLPNLTGIQRTTVGILNGLVARGVSPRLVHYDVRQRRFDAINVHDLPEEVTRYFPWVEDAPARPAASAAPGAHAPETPRKKKRWRTRDVIFGTTTAAADLRWSVREFRHAARKLGKQIVRWAGVRFRMPAIAGACLSRGSRTVPRPMPPLPTGGIGGAGDILFSLCASWTIPGHAEAAAFLRTRGVTVLRMIYDLIPTIKPQWVDGATARQFTAWVRNLLTESDGVITISEFSRSEIETYCAESHLAVPPITVVRLGDALESASDLTPPLPRFVPKRPFFVCVSTLDVRKNHRLLYDAWQVLAARDAASCPDLVCLGLPHLYVTDLLREIRYDQAVNGRIHFLQGVNDDELAWYYRHCAATIYPSRYEGWGLPVAESLGHGRLCLASNATSIPEISHDLPVFFDPFDVHGLVALVDRTLADPAWVASREDAIRSGFQPTPWSHTAGQMLVAAEAAQASRCGAAAA